MNEFEKIHRYFVDPYSDNERSSTNKPTLKNASLVLGIGDDCAEVLVPDDMSLLVSIDTLVEGVHFIKGTPANLMAERAVAVSISDLAAMGAKPKWLTLALSTSHASSTWWESFSLGLKSALNTYGVQLIGGDTTHSGESGLTTLSLQVHGLAPQHTSLKRSGAKVGDLVFVSGSLGDGAASLAYLNQAQPFDHTDKQKEQKEREFSNYLTNRFYRPAIDIGFAYALREIAHSAIDISDGLLADLGHICDQSQVCAEINEDLLPLSKYVSEHVDKAQAKNWALNGGDDYRLCFTLPQQQRSALGVLEKKFGVACTCIGNIIPCSQNESPVVVSSKNKKPFLLPSAGYQHF